MLAELLLMLCCQSKVHSASSAEEGRSDALTQDATETAQSFSSKSV